jgi:hypothetical protein
MKSLFLLDAQILPRGIGNTIYNYKEGEGKAEEG